MSALEIDAVIEITKYKVCLFTAFSENYKADRANGFAVMVPHEDVTTNETMKTPSELPAPPPGMQHIHWDIHVFGRKQSEALRLFTFLRRYDMVVTYNGLTYDFRLLFNALPDDEDNDDSKGGSVQPDSEVRKEFKKCVAGWCDVHLDFTTSKGYFAGGLVKFWNTIAKPSTKSAIAMLTIGGHVKGDICPGEFILPGKDQSSNRPNPNLEITIKNILDRYHRIQCYACDKLVKIYDVVTTIALDERIFRQGKSETSVPQAWSPDYTDRIRPIYDCVNLYYIRPPENALMDNLVKHEEFSYMETALPAPIQGRITKKRKV